MTRLFNENQNLKKLPKMSSPPTPEVATRSSPAEGRKPGLTESTESIHTPCELVVRSSPQKHLLPKLPAQQPPTETITLEARTEQNQHLFCNRKNCKMYYFKFANTSRRNDHMRRVHKDNI